MIFMTWITFLQVAVLIFEAGVVVMLVMNFWKNVKEEAFNRKIAAIGKTMEFVGQKLEESAKNKASATKNPESFEELLKRTRDAMQNQPPRD